jgi:hypothetical protein
VCDVLPQRTRSDAARPRCSARLNRLTAFIESQREAFRLVGLLPEGVDSESTHIARVLQLGPSHAGATPHFHPVPQARGSFRTLLLEPEADCGGACRLIPFAFRFIPAPAGNTLVIEKFSARLSPRLR